MFAILRTQTDSFFIVHEVESLMNVLFHVVVEKKPYSADFLVIRADKRRMFLSLAYTQKWLYHLDYSTIYADNVLSPLESK